MIKEASIQIAGLASRNIILAGQLGAAMKRISELEAKEKKKEGK